MLKHDDDGSAVTIANPKTAEFQVWRRRSPTSLRVITFQKVTNALNPFLLVAWLGGTYVAAAGPAEDAQQQPHDAAAHQDI